MLRHLLFLLFATVGTTFIIGGRPNQGVPRLTRQFPGHRSRASSPLRMILFSAGGRKPLVEPLHSNEAFLETLSQHRTEVVVVKFYAGFCKACKTMAPKFRQLATQYEQKGFHFAEIEFMANKDLCRTLGIKKLPCVHFYAGEHGKIEDFVCGPKRVSFPSCCCRAAHLSTCAGRASLTSLVSTSCRFLS